jgi:hypothetical protein
MRVPPSRNRPLAGRAAKLGEQPFAPEVEGRSADCSPRETPFVVEAVAASVSRFDWAGATV